MRHLVDAGRHPDILRRNEHAGADLRGTVTDALTGEPLTGTTVRILELDGAAAEADAGVGLGLARCDQVTGSYGAAAEGTRLCFTPRIGFVAFRHLRVTLDAHITQKDYSHAGLSVGYTF